MQDTTQVILPVSPVIQTDSIQKDSTVRTAKKSSSISVKKDSLTKSVKNSYENNRAKQIVSADPDSGITSTGKINQINFFGNHELKVVHKYPRPLNETTPGWIFPLIILIVISFAWLRAFYNKYFMQIITALFNNNLTNQIVRDENILVQRASILLNIIFNLVVALFLYFVSVHFNWSLGGMSFGLNRYIFFALAVSFAYAFKFLLLKICGYLFHLDREMATYIFNIFLINNAIGILLIPVVLLIAFSNLLSVPVLIYIAVILIGCGFLYRIIRGVAAGFSSPVFSPYYLFLYLCALEFAPLIVLIKILNQA